MNENDKVLDSSYYQMSRFAYRGDEKLGNSIEVTHNKGNHLQKWGASETFHLWGYFCKEKTLK